MAKTLGANEPILLSEDGGDGIAILTLNRPDKRNALSAELIGALTERLRTIGSEQP